MKVALCISGLPRHVEQGFPSILGGLIKPNNPDIFIHTWLDPSQNGGGLNVIMDSYKPTRIMMEPQRKFVNSHWNLDRMMASHGRSYKRDKFVEMLYSSWYSVYQANQLKEQYRLENDIVYDYVIRARFDITYSRPLNVSEYDPETLNISNRGLPEEMIDDRFAFGGNDIMNVYSSGFIFLEKVFKIREKLDGIFCGETLVYEVCRMAGIKHQILYDLGCAHLNHG